MKRLERFALFVGMVVGMGAQVWTNPAYAGNPKTTSQYFPPKKPYTTIAPESSGFESTPVAVDTAGAYVIEEYVISKPNESHVVHQPLDAGDNLGMARVTAAMNLFDSLDVTGTPVEIQYNLGYGTGRANTHGDSLTQIKGWKLLHEADPRARYGGAGPDSDVGWCTMGR